MTARELKIANGYRMLASAIVVSAAEDWRELCSGKKIYGESIPGLRRFFKSSFCKTMCGSVDPSIILQRLEKELKESKNKESK